MKETIKKILLSNKISFAEHGKNIGKKALLAIDCPFCGDDNGKHLGIMDGYYTCWRNANHRGNLPYLFSILLGISLTEAKLLLQEKSFIDDNLLDNLNEICYTNNIEDKKLGGVDKLIMPKEFHDIKSSGLSKPYYNYLWNRGFDDVPKLVEKYDLKYTLTGRYAFRIIIPIYQDGELMSWQGRAINPDAQLRYKDLKVEDSVRHVKFCLYNYDNLMGGKALFITEGVFDALKLDFYGQRINATCIFTTSIRDEQIALLLQVAHKYEKVFIMLDREAESQALSLLDKLSFIKNIEWYSSLVADDPGSMSKEQIYELENNLT